MLNFIINPNSGGERGYRLWKKLEHHLIKKKIVYKAYITDGIGDAAKIAHDTLLMITHNTRILERLDVDHTHVIVQGHMVAEGPGQLIEQIDREGFERYETLLRSKDGSLLGGDE